jgi:RNA polymerase sigma-54 factor
MRLKLAPQIIQSIEILQLPLLELRDRIDQELMENPLLEMGPASGEEGEGEDSEQSSSEDEGAVEAVEEESEETEEDPLESEDYDALEDMIQPSDYELYGPRSRSSSDGEEDPKRAALENSPAPDISLEEHLRRQLSYFDHDDHIRAICENIVANLDWRGYLEYPLEEITASMDREVTEEEAEEALRIVQHLEPPGVGARDIGECLILQLEEDDPDYEFMHELIQEHFEEIAKNRYPKVAKAMGCTMDRLKEAVERIAKLNPIPGALFGEEAAPHVIPDLRVEWIEGEFRVILEDTSLPSLRICSYYARRLQQKGLDPKTREYLKDKLQSARWLIDAIQQRRSTIYNIASAIVEEQEEFLRQGPMHLKPLKMQEIADKVSVHVSTVSRAISGKYMQTPQGIYSMKHFFTGGVEKDDGEMESWEVVRQKLQHIIENEDKSDPLSDEQLAGELEKRGIEIARRTVSKYRKILGIPSSRRRREY